MARLAALVVSVYDDNWDPVWEQHIYGNVFTLRLFAVRRVSAVTRLERITAKYDGKDHPVVTTSFARIPLDNISPETVTQVLRLPQLENLAISHPCSSLTRETILHKVELVKFFLLRAHSLKKVIIPFCLLDNVEDVLEPLQQANILSSLTVEIPTILDRHRIESQYLFDRTPALTKAIEGLVQSLQELTLLRGLENSQLLRDFLRRTFNKANTSEDGSSVTYFKGDYKLLYRSFELTPSVRIFTSLF